MAPANDCKLGVADDITAFNRELEAFMKYESQQLYPKSQGAEVATFGQGRRRRKSKANPKSKKITHKNIRKMQDEIMRVLKG